MEAYRVRRQFLIGEPQWAQDNLHAIEAKVDPSDNMSLQKLDFRQRAAMLQQILKERFAVKAHYEDVEQSVYALASQRGVTSRPVSFRGIGIGFNKCE
jgi:uncharacterized protein (TIGR03435 family)